MSERHLSGGLGSGAASALLWPFAVHAQLAQRLRRRRSTGTSFKLTRKEHQLEWTAKYVLPIRSINASADGSFVEALAIHLFWLDLVAGGVHELIVLPKRWVLACKL